MKKIFYKNTFSNALSGYWTNAFSWGRATRMEYWVSSITYNVVIPLSLYVESPLLFWIYSIIIVIPSFTLRVRRLHDISVSAYAMLFMFLGPLGYIILLLTAIISGDKEKNIYGEPRR